jgi:hypothetical protein
LHRAVLFLYGIRKTSPKSAGISERFQRPFLLSCLYGKEMIIVFLLNCSERPK